MTNSTGDTKLAKATAAATDPKVAVPILLFTFVFSLIMDNGFKTMTMPMAAGLGISDNTASLQASLAGVIIGIGAVVYAALADSISIRKLLLVGIGLTALGSIIGFIFSSSWPMVLAGRLIMTAGLAAAETLYVIYVTKHLGEKDQKKYLGFSTAAFQAGLLFGALTSGFVSTYISWTAMFLIPLFLILTVPVIIKTVPEDEAVEAHLDIYGLLLISVFATCLILYIQAFNWIWLIPTVIGVVLFAMHVRGSSRALVKPEFFTNGRYVWAIVLVFIVYSTQLGFIIFLPYAAQDLHGLSGDKTALLMVPGYVCAILVGVFSGKIGEYLSSRTTIRLALLMISGSLAMAAFFVETNIATLIVAIIFFASGFALLYAPLVNTALQNIPAAKSGIAIGFYNLTINIAIPLGIAYTAKFMDMGTRFLGSVSVSTTEQGELYTTVLWILFGISLVGAIIYVLADRAMLATEQKQGVPAEIPV
ncbi:MFS transporter [Corynebacterium ulceribovis]|uniref:MFS transporter n=1 Tax=Corynebacterium ulceribovis TaxID=487732 RepID=UPI00036BF83A|nr:MFS transporter [Corynebacterium ulceribovis]